MIPIASPHWDIATPSRARRGLRPFTSTGILTRRNSQRRHVVAQHKDDMSPNFAPGTRQMIGNILRTQFRPGRGIPTTLLRAIDLDPLRKQPFGDCDMFPRPDRQSTGSSGSQAAFKRQFSRPITTSAAPSQATDLSPTY
jgi:hypothetical protein